MERSQGAAILAVALCVCYGCGGDDDSGTGGTGAAAGRGGTGGHAGVAGAAAKGGAQSNAGSAGTIGVGGRGGTSNGGVGGVLDGGRGGTGNGARGGTSSIGGSAGEADGGQAGAGRAGAGQAGAEGGASPGTGGGDGGAGEPGAGSGGEGGQTCIPGANLIENGGFEDGNFAFATEYALVTAPDQLDDTDQCIVAPDASVVREGATDWAEFGDHTSGSGQMFICDGSVSGDTYAWSQTVTVEPHQRYALHFWFASVEASATFLPSFQPFADAVAIGDPLEADSSGAWTEYTGFYQAGDDTTVTLSIVDTSTEGAQNDFALDDVSLALTCTP